MQRPDRDRNTEIVKGKKKYSVRECNGRVYHGKIKVGYVDLNVKLQRKYFILIINN